MKIGERGEVKDGGDELSTVDETRASRSAGSSRQEGPLREGHRHPSRAAARS